MDLRDELDFTNSEINNNRFCWPGLIISLISLLATLPAFIYGFINNFIPYYLPIWVSTIFEDEQFKSSAKFVVSAILFPLFYLLQTTLILLSTSSFVALIYLLSLPVSAIICWRWANFFSYTYNGLRYLFKSLSGDKSLIELKELHNQIIVSTNQMIG